ncbi:pseudouridine kinase [Oceanotoga teriensis]|uniref:Pseudouridine kinase n=1 Tax=Oceanotoga teriensis TaxID=515440 RepID=A0AA45C5Y5_9BACT|nr:carbohydrate kinase family protein [Oceanotoga teriensis]PWJ90046.1 pseudouridine kinase [Oceanotoga teriensis]
MSYVSVIGGINIDLNAKTDYNYKFNSNPGNIFYSAGGVGRNIAENISKLGIKTYLFGVVGLDIFGEYVIDTTKNINLDLSRILKTKKYSTGIYLSILNNDNDMSYAISDMKINSLIDRNYIKNNLEILLNSKLCIIDTNLDYETILYIVHFLNCNKIKYIIEPVSIQKINKLYNIKENIQCITPNIVELRNFIDEDFVFNNEKEDNDNDIKKIFDLIKYKINFIDDIIVTLGKDGVLFFDIINDEYFYEKSFSIEVINANGAGDAFLAGYSYGIYNEFDKIKSVRLGICNSLINLQSDDTVSKLLSEDLLKKTYWRFYNEFI